ncbi:MAG: EmrB/QacA subfamily drug resistance transporter [Candidatus Saccharibacteria bacterium]|nr:EmrB/QacA subfamily drug resistance transporter [Candidatus Saccharibacteria bacterium]
MIKRVVHKNLVLLIVAVAQFIVVLDTSIVNVALPSIYKALSFASTSTLQWVVTAYTLAFGGFLLLGGRAADLYGRRKLFIGAVTAFSILSLLTGLAQTDTQIIVLRALQGLAAAFMSPAALSIVLTTFKEGKERTGALSIWGAVAAGGAAVGVLLGGVLTEYLDWRWNFFVNVPIGLGIAVAAYLYVPNSKADLDHNKLDLPGAVLVTAGLMALVYTFTKAPSYGWTDPLTLVLFAVSAALLAGFIVNEHLSKHALMPLGIFKIANVAAANVAQLPIMAAMFSMFFFVTLYVQQVLGYSPVMSGLSFLPITFVIGGISVLMQHVIGRIGYKKPLVVAPVLIAIGLFLLAHLSVGGSYWTDVFPGLIITAAGMGMTFITITIAATTGVPANESGLASGLLNTSQQVGGSLGLAILSGISASAAAAYIAAHHGAVNMAQAQVTGFSHALYVGVIFALLSSVVSAIFIREKKGEKIDPKAAMAVG